MANISRMPVEMQVRRAKAVWFGIIFGPVFAGTIFYLASIAAKWITVSVGRALEMISIISWIGWVFFALSFGIFTAIACCVVGAYLFRHTSPIRLYHVLLVVGGVVPVLYVARLVTGLAFLSHGNLVEALLLSLISAALCWWFTRHWLA